VGVLLPINQSSALYMLDLGALCQWMERYPPDGKKSRTFLVWL